MLQIIVVYFAPFYVFRMQVGTGYRFPAVIVAFVINYAAYFAEIYRAGIESIPVGQYEAAQVLGLKKPPRVIESYDISNWGDGSSVCGMVVFQDGKPHRAGYRRLRRCEAAQARLPPL